MKDMTPAQEKRLADAEAPVHSRRAQLDTELAAVYASPAWKAAQLKVDEAGHALERAVLSGSIETPERADLIKVRTEEKAIAIGKRDLLIANVHKTYQQDCRPHDSAIAKANAANDAERSK